MIAAIRTSPEIDELLVTGFEGPCTCYAVHLSADGAKIIRPSAGENGETLVGEAKEKATTAFAAIRDLMNEIVED